MRVISPAFMWAQNASHVFVEVKYAHKLSAPAKRAEISQCKLTAGGLLLLATSPEQNFQLDLRFFRDVDSDASTWSTGSVGTVTFKLIKAAKGQRDRAASKKSANSSVLVVQSRDLIIRDES